MSDLAKTAHDRREAMALDLAAYKALAREQMATIRQLAEENQDLRMEVHALQGGAVTLNEAQHTATADCPGSECMQCGARDCPYGEPLHYHHDGCPACARRAETDAMLARL